MTTGEKIRNMRQNAGYTQEQLAEQLSVSRQAIAKWEADRGVPDIENLKAIAGFFGSSLDELIYSDNGAEQENPQSVEPIAENADGIDNFNVENKEPQAQAKTKKTKFRFILIICALVLIALLIAVPFIKNAVAMKRAEMMMDNGNYSAAAEAFRVIGTESAKEKYNECVYLYAKELYEKGDYENAIKEINKISYKDSEDLSNGWKYEYALYYVKAENYAAAINLFSELGEYNNCNDKYTELCNYYGIKLYNEKSFKEAATYLKKADNSLWKNAEYYYAVSLHQNGEYGEAYNAFVTAAKNGNADAAEVACSILKNLLYKTYGVWTHSGDFDIVVLFGDTSSFANNEGFNIGFRDSSGNYKYTFKYATRVIHSKYQDQPVVMLAMNAKNNDNKYFITFAFSGNDTAYIHFHESMEEWKCSSICAKYTAVSGLDLSKYNYKISADSFSQKALPKLSFSGEIDGLSDKSITSEENGQSVAEQTQVGQSQEVNNGNSYASDQNGNNSSAQSQSGQTAANKTGTTTTNNSSGGSSSGSGGSGGSSGSTASQCERYGHVWKEATCTTPKTCKICKKTEGSALSHDMYFTKCTRCNYSDFTNYTVNSNTFCLDSWYFNYETGTHYLNDGEASISINNKGVCKVTFDKYSYTVTLVQTKYDVDGLHFDCYMNGKRLENTEVTYYYSQDRCEFFSYGGTLGFSQLVLEFDM